MKKKGLIISTVVMVVVLIASLTTATYAWFSTQAQAEITNISVTTASTEGLQIGVITTKTDPYTSGYTYGNITYSATDNFGSEEGYDGWGTLADFSNLKESLGTMQDAVTLVTEDEISTKYTGKVFKTTTFASGVFELNSSNKMVPTNDDSAKDGKTYYTTDTVVAGDYLVPLAYDGNVKPTCYAKAVANGDGTEKSADYLVLPIGVRATMNVYAILCTITVKPDFARIANQQYKPGMAAACNITLKDLAESGKSKTVQAYPDVKKGASASSGTSKDAPEWKYSFVVLADKDNAITALTAKNIQYTIWIEGEDDMCDNLTAGSGFSVDISYTYETGTTNMTFDDNDNPTKLTITAGTENAGVYEIIF